jgi:hypothetical protein
MKDVCMVNSKFKSFLLSASCMPSPTHCLMHHEKVLTKSQALLVLFDLHDIGGVGSNILLIRR